MARWIKTLLGAALGVAAFASNAQTCTTTLNNGGNLQAAINAAASGSGVICLNAGTYTAPAAGGGVFPADGAFAIDRNIIIRGLGASPNDVVLAASSSGADHTIKFVNYQGVNASGAQLVNLRIQGSHGGVQVFDYVGNPGGGSSRLTDIKLKDVVITTITPASLGFGVLVRRSDRIVLDNVTITSHLNAVRLQDSNDSLVMNSTITSTVGENAAGLAILAGSNNRIINNTIGQPRTAAGQPYSFNSGGVVLFNTSNNRFEGNIVQGMRDDSVNVSIFNLAPDGLPNQRALNNYIAKNVITHSDFPIDNQVLHSSGVWSNCGSTGSWIYGNTITGTAECGICVWGSKSNMVRGNTSFNNGISGMFVSGGNEINEFCTANGGAFIEKPVNTFLHSNANYFNKNDQVVVRNADNTELARNFSHPRNGFNGTTQGCINAGCQAAISVETDGSGFGSTNGTRILANTGVDNLRGFWGDTPNVGPIDFYLNRTINSANMRWQTGPVAIDRGAILGGNQWSQHIPTGNPSNGSQPFTGIFHNLANQTGNIVDNYPYQTEDLGRGYNVTVYEPLAGSSAARGTRRTVRWDSIGCYWVDIMLNGALLAGNVPNTGYHIITIPAGASLGNTNIVVLCKDRSGNVRSNGFSPTFAVTSGTLTLVSPGREETYNTNQSVWVAWRNTDRAANQTVFIEYSPNGGSTWPTTLATISNQNTSTLVQSSARVTLPGTASGNAMIRVRSSASVVDQTDGVFSLRGGAGALTNVSAGRVFRMGQMERLEWSSPQGSRLVTITATSGNGVTVATDLPDRGSYDWIVPAFTPGALSITLTFKDDAGATIGAPVVNNSAGVTRYSTTITFGNPPSLQPGQSGALPVTVNAPGGTFALTSGTPGVCTITNPNTINIVSNGTCTISATSPGTATYAATTGPVVLSFTTGQTQTITFNMQPFLAVSSTITLSATASSGLTVTFSSLTPSICAVSGTSLTVNTTGTCTVAANQAGNGTFGAAPQVTDSAQAVPPSDVPRPVNIATRGHVGTGDNVLIGGFIIGGNGPKNVVVRARGPSLAQFGVAGVLANPVLQLYSGQTQIDSNDNWQSHPNAAQASASTFAPTDPNEAAIFTNLGPGGFTAIVSGAGGGTGVAIVEVFEVDRPDRPLVNIATRGNVGTGDNVMIGGFILGGSTTQTVLIRARGPSLAQFGVPGTLSNPTLEIYSGQTVIASNDNWQTNGNAAAITATGFAPSDANESAVLLTLAPGPYTAIVRGVSNTTGVAIVEVFSVIQ